MNNRRLMKPSDFPMAQSLFDEDGIYASNDYLKGIALQVLEQEKRERECRRVTRYDNWGYWNISDRD